ncbi:MAG: type IV toxin-antitoxin system AbiEi family antitoxin, partial [Porticoccaceae bacterium]|nr:type IV toxin-antitoxin system AbiEi family antitoxin [Porticoccaceae bacterium]
MNGVTIEKDILPVAIDAIYREAGLQLKVAEDYVEQGDRRVDAVLCMQGTKTLLNAKIKRQMTKANLGAVVNQLNQVAEPGCALLVADYINPNIGKNLKQAGIQFIDAAGNAYINQPPVYIYIKGNRLTPTAKLEGRVRTGKAFQTAGMKIVFAFLRDKELINAPYREIAEKAQVALGAVGPVVKDLVAQGVILQGVKNNQRQIADFEQLLDRWVEAYPYKLKEKHRIGTFTTDNPEWWKAVDLEKYTGLWGGEIAAAKYTNYLNPKHAVVYINKAD